MNQHGGARPGAGRPKGAISRAAKDAIKRAKASGELPHEFLLRVSRGEKIDGKVSSIQARIDAAKAAAPYFAAKLSVAEYHQFDPHDLRNMTDEELEAEIKASEASLAAIKRRDRVDTRREP